MAGRRGGLLIEEIAAAGLVVGGHVFGPTGDDFADGSFGLELLDGGIVAEEEEGFGEVEMVGIFFVQRGGDFEANPHGTQGGAVGDADPNAAAALASL